MRVHENAWGRSLICVTVECRLFELQSSEHVGQPNVTHENFYLINAHVPWRQLHEELALYSLPCSIVGTCSFWLSGFAVLLLQTKKRFSSSFVPLLALRMSSVTPRKRKRSVLGIEQKLEICDRARNGWTYSRFSAVLCVKIHSICVYLCIINMRLVKLQTYGIVRVMDRVRSRRVRITDIPLYHISSSSNCNYYTFQVLT